MALSFAMTATFANTPQFKDYPAKVYTGPAAKLKLNNEFAKTFKTRFSSALNQKPTFAGEYVLVSWGCGAGCVVDAFVNKRTGEVVEDSFGGDGEETIEASRLNSKLLVTKETIVDGDYNPIGERVKHYTIENSKFKLIKLVPLKK